MTYEDIARTMKTDFEQELAKGYNSCFGMREKLGKKAMALRVDEYKCFGSHTKETRNGNKYIFLYLTRGRNDYKMNGILRHVRLEYMRRDGTHAAVFDLSDFNNVTFYTPHFFERVRTRLFNDEDIKLSEVRDMFFYSHFGNRVSRIDNPKYKNSIFSVSPNGISLGEMISPALWEFRTYISFDMLKDDQNVITEEGMNIFEIMREATQTCPGLLSPNIASKYL